MYVRTNEQTNEHMKIENPGVSRPLLGPAKKIVFILSEWRRLLLKLTPNTSSVELKYNFVLFCIFLLL